MQLAHPPLSIPPAARLLTRDLPRDQALGLRLMALAQAAAAIHMGQSLPSANTDSIAHNHADPRHLLRTQASGLFSPLPTAHSPLPNS